MEDAKADSIDGATQRPATEGSDLTCSVGMSLNKQDKGRFKKLRKRLESVASNEQASGFVSLNEYDEWNDLASNIGKAPSADPKFVWRKGFPIGRRTEGSHHRDVLFSLLLPPPPATTTSGGSLKNHGRDKKRPRPELNTTAPSREVMMKHYKSLPSWLCLHNPAAIRHVGVLEIHVHTKEQMESLQKSIVEHLTSSDGKGRSHLVAPTRWFSGSSGHDRQIKSMTDALLFATPPPPPKESKNSQTPLQTLSGLVRELGKLVVSTEDLVKSGYPVAPESLAALAESSEDTSNLSASSINVEDGTWFASPRKSANHSGINLFALDCEMVDTTEGRALARLTLIQAINYNPKRSKVETKVVLDTLVQPEHPVTDYLTRYSGVTREILKKGPTMSLSQVHEFLAAHVAQDDIVVGHSLENDLQVCRWIHPCCVDTALLFARGANFKYGLRHLTRVLLKRDIQLPNQSHCSEEDAEAALDLAVGRAVKGPVFNPKDTRSTNRWTELSRNQKQTDNASVLAVGPSTWLQRYITNPPNGAHALSCDKCTDPNAKALLSFMNPSGNNSRRAGLVWSQFHVSNEQELGSCDLLIQQLLATASSSDTILLIAIQCRFGEMLQETLRRRTLRNPKTTMTWTDGDEKAYVEGLEESRLGVSIWVGGKKV